MQKYAYNAELAGPGFGVDITNDGPLMRLYIAWNKLFNRTVSNMWKAPEQVEKRRVSIPCRDGAKIGGWLLEPKGRRGRVPAMLYCHGGAFFMPILSSSLAVAAYYVRELGCGVLMPEYRLTPKHRYPIPLDDCCDALACLRRRAGDWGLDPEKLLLYGESAGGCLAAEVTHCCRDERLARPMGQILIYPVTDAGEDYPSLTEYQFAPWSKRANAVMWKLYLPACSVGDMGRAIPMERDNFEDIPPTYIETAQADVLRDQGLAYGEKLQGAGVKVWSETVPGAYHGFDGEMNSPLVRRILARRVEIFRQMLQSSKETLI